MIRGRKNFTIHWHSKYNFINDDQMNLKRERERGSAKRVNVKVKNIPIECISSGNGDPNGSGLHCAGHELNTESGALRLFVSRD